MKRDSGRWWVRGGAIAALGLLALAVWFAVALTASPADAFQSNGNGTGDSALRLPSSIETVITVATTLGLTLLTERVKWMVAVDRPGTREARSGWFRPLLTPCEQFDVAQMERTGRIPIEPRVNHEGRVGLFRRSAVRLLSPSYAKPAFLLSAWHKADGATVHPAVDELPVGGYRLYLRVPDSEHRAHLRASISLTLSRSTRTLLICTPEAYLSSSGIVHCCSINGYHVKYSSERPDTLIVYSADPQRLGAPNYRVCRRSEVPSDGVWLLSLDRAAGRNPSQPELLEQFEPVEGYRPDCERLSRIWTRLKHQAVGGHLLPRDPCDRSLITFVVVSALFLAPAPVIFPSVQELLLEHITLGWYFFCAYLALAIAYVWFLYVSTRITAFLTRQLDASPRWTATTTRCLSDGAHSRNGLYRHLDDHQRTQIKPNQPEPRHTDST